MEKTKKNNPPFEKWRNNFYIKSHRRTNLIIDYRKLLFEDKTIKENSFLEETKKQYQEYFERKISKEMIVINNISSNDIKRKKLLETFDEHFYWKKREYKTSLQKQSISYEEFTQLLADFDNNVKKRRDLYAQKLKTDYPHIDYDIQKIDVAKKRVEKIKQKWEDVISKKAKKSEANRRKLIDFKVKNDEYIAKKEQKSEKLVELIDKYNKEVLNKKQERLLILNERYAALMEKCQVNVLNRRRRKAFNLKSKIDTIELTGELIKNENIQLSIKDLRMYFGGVKAVNDLSFNVRRGEIFGLIGPNGAGKTTVFNCVTQFYKSTSGAIVFRNKDNSVVDLNQIQPHKIITEGISRSFQNVELIWELTVLDNLLVASHSLFLSGFFEHLIHSPRLVREEKVLRLKGYKILEMLGIQEYAYRVPYGLPYGVLKKIELARTLMTNPSLIILDEPAAGLNETETKELAEIIKKINDELKITFFLVEHDMDLVMSICDTVCAISFGRLLAIGTPSEIQSNNDVRKAYLGEDDE